MPYPRALLRLIVASLSSAMLLSSALLPPLAGPASAQNRDFERRIVTLDESALWYNYAPALMWDSDTGTYKLYTCFGEQVPGVGGQDIIMVQEALTLDELALAPPRRAFAPPTGPDANVAWDRHHTCDPNVIKHHGKYYLYYGGLNNDRSLMIKETAFGVAVSDDGRSFERLADPSPIGFQTADIGWLYGIGQPAVALGPDDMFYLVHTSQATPQRPTLHELVFLRSTEPTFRPETTTELLRIDANQLGVGVSVDFFYDSHRDQFGVVGNLSANLPGQTHIVITYLDRDLRAVATTQFETWELRFGEGVAVLRDSSGRTGALPDGREGLITFAGATFSDRPPQGIPAHISGPTEIVQFRRDIDLDGISDIAEGFYDPALLTIEDLLVAYPHARTLSDLLAQRITKHTRRSPSKPFF